LAPGAIRTTGEEEPLQEGEEVLLWAPSGESAILRLVRGPQSVEGRGVVDLSDAVGKAPGILLDWAGTPHRVLRPSFGDRLRALRRKAQVVTPKDATALLLLTGIGPGDRVAEAGSGSGWLTVWLAHAVGPQGRVYSFDRRPDFLEVARANVKRAGFAERVEFQQRDVVSEGWGVNRLTAILLDLPEPWSALAPCRDALRLGGRVAGYTPTYNQLERFRHALRDDGFQEAESLELLQRTIEVGEGGTRPAFEMLGHTGFLTAARWMGPPW
jgi:tRNA (adenine57-N1/adenine58-N1)-methyltransferase catalytic subunit